MAGCCSRLLQVSAEGVAGRGRHGGMWSGGSAVGRPLLAFFSAMSSIITTHPSEIRMARGPVYSSEKNGVPSCWWTMEEGGARRQAVTGGTWRGAGRPGGVVVVGGERSPHTWWTSRATR